jgi:hypothetical protein
MRTTNLPAGSQRISNVGLVWEEVLTGASGTFTVRQQQTFRVSATAACTVSIDGVLAMTMQAGEVEYFNAGEGVKENSTRKSEITITGSANVQVARSVEQGGRRTP